LGQKTKIHKFDILRKIFRKGENMFTGIVQGTALIHSITEKANFRTQVVKLPPEMRKDLEIGASVANNGVCLTVTEVNGDLVSFDLMQETLRITNLGLLKVGDNVNIEVTSTKEAHYIPKDDELVTTLMDVYRKYTGDTENDAFVLGGGTYARCLKKGVAFGLLFPGKHDTMHQANEFLEIEDLLLATAIYAEGIYKLCCE